MKSCIAAKTGAEGVMILDENNNEVVRVTAWDVI